MPLTVKSGHPCPGVSLRQAGYGAMRTSFRVVSEEALILNLHSLPVCLDLCGKPSYSGDLVSSCLIPSGPWDLLHFKPCLGICLCKY